MVPDDLKVGMFVAVVGRLDGWDGPEDYADYAGKPMRIEAISLPFVAVECEGEMCAIDARVWRFGKISRAYAAAMGFFAEDCDCPACAPVQGNAPAAADDGYRRCVRCGERMVQRLTEAKAKVKAWHHVCPKCGSDGGLVEAKA
jgi:hypothetical protein